MKTVFIIDDDASIRKSLSRLLKAAGVDSEEFSCGQAFLDRKANPKVGCILLDVNMPGLNGIQLQKELNRTGSSLPIIFLTGYGNISMSVEAMKRGAIDFLTKPVDESDLLNAINHALNHHQAIQAEAGIQESIKTRLELLTPREEDVLRILITGAPNKLVADQLSIAVKTVKIHRAHLLQKMQVRSIAELLHLCHLVGLEPDTSALPIAED